MYGLKSKEFYEIIKILEDHSKEINWVKLFGSRAREDYKKTSDIDLAISFKKDILLDLIDLFQESQIGYKIDIIDYDKNTNLVLKKNIDDEGKLILISNSKGEILMNINKLNDKLNDFSKALKKLKESLTKDPRIDDLYLDGTIQRFEFVFELSWKLMKNYLEFNGLSASSPRETFRVAFQDGLLEDAKLWIKMMENRNRTSHTYNEDTAFEIYDKIKNEYIYLFEEFSETIHKKIEGLE